MFPGSKRSSGSFGASKRPRQHVPSSLGVGIVDGRCLTVYWSEGSVAGGINLEMLKTVMWPSVRVQAARRGYWFQQDGAPVHVTPEVMDFLRSKFGDRLLSRRTQHHWPVATLQSGFVLPGLWPQASQGVAERMPETRFEELKAIVEGFARRMDDDQPRRMAWHTRRRAKLCCAEGEGTSSTSCGRTKSHS